MAILFLTISSSAFCYFVRDKANGEHWLSERAIVLEEEEGYNSSYEQSFNS